MRPFTSTIPLDEALKRLAATVTPIARVERVGLADAAGRVAAAPIASTLDVPRFARSAMDGYAIRSADVVSATREVPTRLHIVERIYTGAPPTRPIAAGQCSEIATGAPLPQGSDAVIMVEETTRAGDDEVALHASATPGQNVSRAGSDIVAGDLVVRAGDHLTPARVGAIAAIGVASLDVHGKPRVAILSTGNEVIEPGTPLAPGQIYDVNRFTLSAVAAAHGCVPTIYRPAHDTHDALDAALDGCRDADVIVFSGGSSVGERDLVADLVARRGEMIFHGVAIKPGKPTALARVDGRPFFGMPGNPTSCLSNAYIFLVPFLRATARLPPWRPETIPVPLGARIVSPANRHQFYTVRIDSGAAWPAFKGSGDITSLSRADGYIEIPAGQGIIEKGVIVEVRVF